MPLLPIQLPPGIERNGTPYDTPGQWWDMNLMRWVSGTARPVGGWVRQTGVPLDSPIRRFHAWRKNDSSLGTLVGTDAKLYVDFAGNWLNITPVGIVPPINTLLGGYGSGLYGAGTYGTPRPAIPSPFAPGYALWSFDNWGQDVFFLSSKDNRLFQYISATPDTVPVALAAPPRSNAVGVTDERHVMLAGPVIGGTYFPHRICWCSREDPTDWNFSSVTNTAGFLDLTTSSPLIYICKVREGMLVFSMTDVFLVQFIGSPYIYNATKIAEGTIYHPYSIATFGGGRAMWPTQRGMQLYSAGQVQVLPCPVLNDIKADFAPNWGPIRMHSSHNGNFPEVWMFWPSAGVTECDRYVMWNYQDNWWGWGSLQRTAMFSSGALPRPFMGSADGNIYDHENGWTAAGTPILSARFLESGALGVGGNNMIDVKQAMLATRASTADLQQVVQLKFFARYAADGSETTFGPYLPRLDGYTDTRVNGREVRVRYVGNVDALFDVGQLRLEVSAGGER